jgi:integrase
MTADEFRVQDGYCRVKGESHIYIDRKRSIKEKIRVLANELKRFRVTVKQFLGLLTSANNKSGKPLRRGTIENILTPLKEIYYDAIDQYEWDLPDPFTRLGKCIPEGKTEDVQVFTFVEWMKILDELFWVYKPSAEFSVMTGVRPSEIAGLRKEIDVKERLIQVQHSIVKKREKDELKTASSRRTLPITSKVQEVIDRQIEIKEKLGRNSSYFFINSAGKPFDIEVFRENAWKSALKRAKVPYRKPYAMRHTFAAWMLLAGVSPGEVARLMGHSSKKMVYEVYGHFVEELQSEKEQIEEYLGIRNGQPFQMDEDDV